MKKVKVAKSEKVGVRQETRYMEKVQETISVNVLQDKKLSGENSNKVSDSVPRNKVSGASLCHKVSDSVPRDKVGKFIVKAGPKYRSSLTKTSTGPYTCYQCRYRFNESQDLISHIHERHLGYQRFVLIFNAIYIIISSISKFKKSN